MGIAERLEIYRRIGEHRKRPLIAYVTSKREGVDAAMATDVLPYLIDQLDCLPDDTTELDFLIVSPGGDPMVAWRIMSLIRQRLDKVSVLVPQSAYSAATLLALGADEIVMHPNGHLGPVDMQISTVGEGGRRHFSTEDIRSFLEFVKESLGITDQEHLRRLFEAMCKEVGSLGVGFTARSQQLAVSLGEKLLNMHMEDGNEGTRASLVERLSRQFHSHQYPVSRSEAIEIGLPVNDQRDATTEALMWELWLDLEEELKERVPFHPISELLNSPLASELLAPAPQLVMPPNAPTPSYIQADFQAVIAAAKPIMPLDFSTVDAIIESERLAYFGQTKGKILASRMPDLNLRFSTLVSFRGWERMHSVEGIENENQN